MSEPQSLAAMTLFEASRHTDDAGGEYWSARDLMGLLGYKSWQNFERTAITEAMAICSKEGVDAVERNFNAIIKNSPGESARGRKGSDYHLSRHACYLIAMSADGTKLEVAMAKIYFAVAVEQLELITAFEEELLRLEARPELRAQNKQLATLARQAGIITDLEFAAFWDAGYLGLYREVAKQISARKGITQSKDIGDYASSTEIGYNIFKATLAREMMQARGVTTKDGAIATHFEAGERVRQTIEDAGLPTPEHLATPSKSYQQLLKEQKMRLRLKLEDALGLWARLQEGTTERQGE